MGWWGGGPRIPPVLDQALRPRGVIPLEVVQQRTVERPRRKGCCPAVGVNVVHSRTKCPPHWRQPHSGHSASGVEDRGLGSAMASERTYRGRRAGQGVV